LSTVDLNFWARRGRSDDRAPDNYAATSTAFALALASLAILISAIANVDPAWAQSPGLLAPGNAVVTGFSGAPPPAQIAPGQDPGDLTFIDTTGPSAQVFNLQAPGAPPQAQVMPAPVSLTVTAAQVGQVFGVALDNATPPNMYVAASSAYGLPIVVPGPGGTPMRVHQGAPGATFMAGLFGPAAQGGGPGSIWRIDGVSGAVSLFANVTLSGAANSGPALGGLAFDSASSSLFVADRQTGMIQRFNLSGSRIGQYDHGVQGLTAAGQPQVPYTPSPLDITKPQFSSDDPATWAYAPQQRLIFGLGVHSGRLYYAVAAGLQIWSVGIASNGSFGADARMEVQVPPAQGPTEISKITFDDSGDMILAERAAPTGDYELMALAQAGIGRVLRYTPAPGAPGGWQPVPDQYAIGFPGPMTNANGGVAIGYSYDANGNLDRASCGGFLWSTGEQLRNAADPNLAALLAANGSLFVNGLQGNAIDLVEPANVPPLLTYFVDYDAQLDDPAARGRMGDIAIPRTCGQAALLPFAPPPWLPPWWFAPPVIGFYCPPNQMTPYGQCCPAWQQMVNGACTCPGGLPPGPNGQCACAPGNAPQPGFECCPFGTMPGGGGQCLPICPNGAVNPASVEACLLGFNPVPVGGVFFCLDGVQANPQVGALACIAQSPLAGGASCPQGWAQVPVPNLGVSICEPTPPEIACEQQGMDVGLDGSCQQLCSPGSFPFPTIQCCAIGEVPAPNGICCPAGAVPNPFNGQCCPFGQVPQPYGGCGPPPPPPPPPPLPPPSYCQQAGNTLYCDPIPKGPNAFCLLGHEVAGGCCPAGSMPQGNACVATGPSCGPGDPTICCPAGKVPNFATGQCCPTDIKLVPGGAPPGCQPPPPPCCGLGGGGPSPPGGACLKGYVKVGDKCCEPSQVTSKGQCCPAGQSPSANGTCQPVIRILLCPAGKTFNLHTHTCDPDPACPSGAKRNAAGLCACAAGEKVNADGKCVAACSDAEVMNPFNGRCERKAAKPPPPSPPLTCSPGYVLGANGMCERVTITCPSGEVLGPNGGCVSVPSRPPPACPANKIPGPGGTCICSPQREPCPRGQMQGPDCNCVAAPTCPPGQVIVNGTCVPPVNPTCTGGEVLVDGRCQCPVGEQLKDGRCAAISQPTQCPPGEVPGPSPGTCLKAPVSCLAGQELRDGRCVTITPPAPCPTAGEERNAAGDCVSIRQPTCPAGEVMGPKGCEKPSGPTPTCPAGETMTPRGCEKPSEPTTCPAGEVRTDRGCEKESTKTNEPTPKLEIEKSTPKINVERPPPPTLKLPTPPLRTPEKPAGEEKR